jgi:MFS family permease
VLGNAVQFGAVALLVFSDWIADIHGRKSSREIIALVIFGMFVNFILVARFNVFNGGFIEARTESGRAKIREEIAKLSEKRKQRR